MRKEFEMKMVQSVERISTGPTRFGTDWPGVFIRGDEALAFANKLELLRDFVTDDSFIKSPALKGLIDLLRSCKVD